MVLLAVWTRTVSPWWLAAVGVAALLGIPSAVGSSGSRGLLRRVALLVLLAAVPLGLFGHQRLARVSGDWDGYWAGREAELFTELTDALERLVVRGDEAVEELARLAGPSGDDLDHEAVEELRERSGFGAVAVYGPDGEILVWSGTHRGKVPEDVQAGLTRYVYGELPLFGHLYFTEPVDGTGRVAVVAALLRSDLPRGLRARTGDFTSTFRARTGEEIRVSRTERMRADAAFDFVWEDGASPDTLFSVSVVRPTEVSRRLATQERWVRVGMALAILAWALLATAGRGVREGGRAVAVLFLVGALLPLESVVGDGSWFSPADFVLAPGTLGLTLGRLLVLLLAGVAAASLLLRRWRPRLHPAAAPLAVALLFPLVVAAVTPAASPGFLAGPAAGWTAFQLVLATALSLVAGVALGSGSRDEREPRRPVPVVGGLLLAGGLAVAVALLPGSSVAGDPPYWMLALWGLPVLLVARGLGGERGWRHSILVWAAATVVGTTAALPLAWEERIDARRVVAEERMGRLGADVDPFLDFLLGRMARAVGRLHESGSGPVELLYRSWLDSGLAREGYPVWLTLWGPGGLPREEFLIGVEGRRPGVARRFAEEARGTGRTVVRRFELPDAHYLVTIPLPDGSVVTGAVPPIRELRPSSPLGPLFGGLAGGDEDPLTLVPLLPGDEASYPRTLRWVRTAEGWEGRVLLEYSGQRFHAQYLVAVSGAPLVVARGTLLLALNLLVMLVAWTLVRAVVLGGRPGAFELRPLVTSFRARVTMALFGFFLLSNAIFGTLAYRTISGAAERAARVLAERVAQDGAGVYNEVGGDMELLARQVGADLLEYRDGELREGSTEELVELGLFEGWLPFDVARRLAAREDLLEVRETRLGRWEYVTAFRRLPDGDILAAPVPMQAGATAVRREEVAHLLAFAVVAGGLLSLILALLVGRALARPIRTLQVASERVGGGNLGVRLPADRSDEFGSVFSAFNRMVRRLRSARRELVRTTRRTRAIVEDAATGVIALDPSARITLVNTRASELLDRELEVGTRLREEGTASDEFVRWTRLYFRDGLRELGGEFHFGSRRVRVRARRIEREGSRGGAVVSLEDVTDELRTERVLAWGEMARQVAHEVKNPLTPIKLAIQHIRRAWDDRRPDFGEILTRNADAALREIDRLASIASSFSRFGAPETAGEAPLGPVSLGDVVGEVMALYQSGEGGVRFETDLPDELPTVQARASEMKEVLVNLLENARAAIADEGTVLVRARAAPGGAVLTVRDDGSGISPELLPRVFEPHFSTRAAGTGVGLAIVKRLVESWDATVSLESEPGVGTTARLRLRGWDGEPTDAGGAFPGGEG